MEAERIFVIGGLASGKSTLAREIGKRTGIPVHELDQLARIGGGFGPERDATERDAMVADILASPRWVVEGIHLGWTDGLLAAADVIVWLDHVDWTKSTGRVFRRFVSQAMAEARRQRGWRRFLRLRDYGRVLRALAAALVEPRRYHRTPGMSEGGEGSPADSRAATARVLDRYSDKLVHCRSIGDVQLALERITVASGAPTPAS
jgi:adenylate kinase family enzyme